MMTNVLDQFRLDGRTALVTGCRRGIGRAYAQALAEVGADIVGVSLSLEGDESDVARDVGERGRAFSGYACDLGNRQALYRFISQVDGDGHQIDILINNAGVIRRRPAVEHPDEFWDRTLEVNLSSQFVLAREFGKRMLGRGWGKIVSTASILSFQGGITVPGYAATKGALSQLTMALANEWAGQGINVNAIAPGYTVTDNTQALREDRTRSQQLLARIPAGRWAEPEDLKGAVVYLCSDAASYVNGTTLVIDGGWLGR